MDWKELEANFAAEVEQAIEKWMDKNPKHTVYAIAFTESYRELDDQIEFPRLAINSIETLRREQDTEDIEFEWDPMDWRWENILPRKSVRPFEKQVFKEANQSTQDHWFKTEKRFVSMIVRVAKSTRKKFAKHPNTTKDFVVYFDDEEGGIDLVKKCVPAALFDKLFSEFVDESLEALSEEERLEKFFSEPWMHEKQIIALGKSAIDPLLKMFDHPKNHWLAASLLDNLGIQEVRIKRALRKQVQTSKNAGAAEQSAITLRFWGDEEFLFESVNKKKSQRAAVRGLVAGLLVRASDRSDPIPLDYQHVERLLEMNNPAINDLVATELQPGSSFIEMKSSDVDEALRGLESKHVIIRQHAVCILGERGLGRAVAKRALPKLAERLEDSEPNVRRLTLLSLSYWKAASKPYHAAMKRLQLEDPDKEVRICATYVFE